MNWIWLGGGGARAGGAGRFCAENDHAGRNRSGVFPRLAASPGRREAGCDGAGDRLAPKPPRKNITLPALELKVAVVGRFRPGDTAQILGGTPVRIPVGGSFGIHVRLPTGPRLSNIQFELSEPPDGFSLKESSPTEIVLQADAAKVKPGLTGDLIVKASAEESLPETEAPAASRQRVSLGALPAIPYEIVPR